MIGPAVQFENVVRLSGGASRDTWAFEADGRPLVLQQRRPGAAGPAVDAAALLRAAAGCGVPVPAVVADGDGWIVTERVEGETLGRRIVGDDRFARQRPGLVAQCGRALAAVHSIPLAAVPGLVAGDELDRWRAVVDDLGHRSPAFELGFRWLAANRPAPSEPVVVHGDFRMGNLVVGDGGLAAVLDWELAHVGDRCEDLGWLCVRAWRFGGPGRVAGIGSVEDLVAAYSAASGVAVDPAAVAWWEALGTLKWGIMCLLQASAHLTGAVRSVELAAIGRRAHENEWDLLELVR